jgi:hypothetical protein
LVDTASSAADRITLEIETLAELAAATARLNDLQLTERPIGSRRSWSTRPLRRSRASSNAPRWTRGVATVRDLFDPVDVDSRELKAVAVWNISTDQGVNRSHAVSEWLRR